MEENGTGNVATTRGSRRVATTRRMRMGGRHTARTLNPQTTLASLVHEASLEEVPPLPPSHSIGFALLCRMSWSRLQRLHSPCGSLGRTCRPRRPHLETHKPSVTHDGGHRTFRWRNARHCGRLGQIASERKSKISAVHFNEVNLVPITQAPINHGVTRGWSEWRLGTSEVCL